MESSSDAAMLAMPDGQRSAWVRVDPALCASGSMDDSVAPLAVSRLNDHPAEACIEDAIAIYVPSDRGAFHLTHETPGHGARRLFVPAPLISVVPAGHPHSIECSRPADTLRLTLGITAFQGDAGRPVERRMPLMGPRWAILDPFMRATGNALRKDLATHGNLPATFLASLAHVLAMHITARYASVSAEAVDPPGLPSHKLVRVRAFIDDHLHTAISVHQLATVIHMSPFHFARMFKKATGSTPHAYLTLRRMQRSQQLLRDTRLPLVDIAAQVGFQTQGHFTVVFHRQVGVTPWAFRREQNAPAALLRSELARTARDCAEARKTRQRVSH